MIWKFSVSSDENRFLTLTQVHNVWVVRRIRRQTAFNDCASLSREVFLQFGSVRRDVCLAGRPLHPKTAESSGPPRRFAHRRTGVLNLKPEQSNIFFKLMEERYHPPLVSMATPLSGPLSDAGGCLISPRLARAAVFGHPRQNFHSDSKKSFGVSPSQSASRLRSFHSHRVRTESETQPTFTARLSVKPAPP